MTLGSQDIKLVVMFGICPVAGIPPDVLLATIVERGLFHLLPTSISNKESPRHDECSSLSIELLNELSEVSSEAGDVDNYFMVLQVVVVSLNIIKDLFTHRDMIQSANSMECERRTSDALGSAAKAACKGIQMIKKSGFALDDLISLFVEVSKCAAIDFPSIHSEDENSEVVLNDQSVNSKIVSAKDFCTEMIRVLCLSLPQSATWRYMLSILLQMVESGPTDLQFPALFTMPILVKEKMHVWTQEDLTMLANTLHRLGKNLRFQRKSSTQSPNVHRKCTM